MYESIDSEIHEIFEHLGRLFDVEVIELLVEHQSDDTNGFIRVWSLSSEHQFRPLGCTEGQKAQNATTVCYLTSALKLNLALKASRYAN
jgi:hypothetical protein